MNPAGWRFVVEELRRVGIRPHLAEPADTSTLHGPKMRAKTDRADARLQRELLTTGRLPESWIPPDHVLEARTKARLYAALSEERKAWLQSFRATLFHEESRLNLRYALRTSHRLIGRNSAGPAAKRLTFRCTRSIGSRTSWSGFGRSCRASAGTSSAAVPCTLSTASVACLQSRSGKSLATAGDFVRPQTRSDSQALT